MGGTNDPSNLVKVTIEKHAQLHKQLWEDLGHWQDRIAWQTLSGQISNAEAIKQAQSNGAKNRKKKIGAENHFYGKKHTNESKQKMSIKLKGKKPHNKGVRGANDPQSKLYEIIDPQGNVFTIKGLKDFCRKNNLLHQAMGQVALGRLNHHKKYKCRRIM